MFTVIARLQIVPWFLSIGSAVSKVTGKYVCNAEVSFKMIILARDLILCRLRTSPFLVRELSEYPG